MLLSAATSGGREKWSESGRPRRLGGAASRAGKGKERENVGGGDADVDDEDELAPGPRPVPVPTEMGTTRGVSADGAGYTSGYNDFSVRPFHTDGSSAFFFSLSNCQGISVFRQGFCFGAESGGGKSLSPGRSSNKKKRARLTRKQVVERHLHLNRSLRRPLTMTVNGRSVPRRRGSGRYHHRTISLIDDTPQEFVQPSLASEDLERRDEVRNGPEREIRGFVAPG